MIEFPKALSKEAWLAKRRGFIGGSDAAKVCGVSPWGNSFDVWLEKTQGLMSDDSEPAYWGRKHERGLLERFQEDHPEIIVKSLKHRIFEHPDLIWMGCTPDALIVGDNDVIAIVEAKSTAMTQAGRWGDEGTDRVPDEVLIQCLHNLIVVSGHVGRRINVCYVPLLVGGNQYREYIVRRGPEAEETQRKVIAAERDFWEKNVVARVEPEFGDSPVAADYLKRKYPADKKPVEIASEKEAEAIAKLKETFLAKQQIESAYNGQVNKIKDMIGDRAGLESSLGRVTHRRSKDGERTDYKAVAYNLEPLINQASFQAAIAEYTKTIPGSRRFVKPISWGKE